MKSIVVFGGNGFIGSEFTSMLIKEGGYELTLINRGKSWDWDSKETIKPFVNCIKFNRENDIHSDKNMNVISHRKYDCIVDFSGYESSYVRDAVSFFKHRAKLYIYISTDSVYEVCEKKHTMHTVESDAERPADPVLQNKLKHRDSYGDDKLKCEEYLQSQLPVDGMDFIILRLADVIGGYDSTERWWQYQTWIEAAVKGNIPVYIRSELCKKMLSFVYVKDVACTIKALITEQNSSILNQSYNLACSENIMLPDFLKLVADNACGCNVNIMSSEDDCVPHIYPSVNYGPIDINKARLAFDFKPTELSKAIQETCKVYGSINNNDRFLSEKESILESLLDDLRDLYSKDDFQKLAKLFKTVLNLK